ncbi:glycosyltransferase [Catelliglobosispora koreensis]|uniref:glycosyltransferase n=1 Tax=Catelliglobosispora koreensis TaxID=129052 RepID=UPI00037A4F33|nr:glycosyltransferase [Catelliglobosispora koreensis]
MTTSYGFVSTHPPTECGLATFNSALVSHLAKNDSRSGIVRVIAGGESGTSDPRVVHTWSDGDVEGWRPAAKALNAFDAVVVQHEYGIYPGEDGHDVVPLLHELEVPSMVVLHTVLTNPTHRQKAVLEEVVRAASAVITMTSTARDRLLAGYAVDPHKVNVIPHGAGDHDRASASKGPRPHLLTWGLLGPGKGIEWALRAVGRLRDLNPRPMYTIAGKTHPRVLEHSGEEYRTGLQNLTELLCISDSVRFDATYLDDASLSRLIRSADVVVLPYDSREQVTSGVLIEAMAAGIPVVATPFPHAVEVLTDGPGLLVPHGDPQAMATAIREIITKPAFATSLLSAPTPATSRWPDVAGQYAALAKRLLAAGPLPVAVPA